MEQKELTQKHNQVLRNLLHIPRKIILLHGNENIPEFVLHDLCHESCFNLSKAAYFVDNPDFDCLKGVVGFDRRECYAPSEKIWEEPESFSLIMQSSPFNQQVRAMIKPSFKRSKIQPDTLMENIAQELHVAHPEYFTWNMKHDNHGVLLYEKSEIDNDWVRQHLENGVYFLSMCPIF